MSKHTTINAALAEVLSRVDRPGAFWGTGAVDLPVLDLMVDGVGRLSLPVMPAQALALAAQGTPAPYGKGADTVVDDTVRRCRQIAASAVHLDPRRWPDVLARVLDDARRALGIDGPVQASLYKMLVYGAGDFFLPHRDTEKVPGMVATLVLALPSDHTGGELQIRHGADEVGISLADSDPGRLRWAAFYADCVHTLKPIVSGHRVALVYNLVIERGTAPQPPEYTREIDEIAQLLKRWRGERNEVEKLAVPLAHRYSMAELAWSHLKNEDQAGASALRAAADASGCVLRLAMVEINEFGSAYETYERSSNYDRWGNRNREPQTHGEFSVIDVDEIYQQLLLFPSPDDPTWAAATLPLDDAEVVPENALEDAEPDESLFHEATGNEGGTYERTYRHAALVLWPREYTGEIYFDAGYTQGAELLLSWVAVGDASLDAPIDALARRLCAAPQARECDDEIAAIRMRPVAGAIGTMLRALAPLSWHYTEAFLTTVAPAVGLMGSDTLALATTLVRLESDRAGDVARRLVCQSLSAPLTYQYGEDDVAPAHTEAAMFVLALAQNRSGTWLSPALEFLVEAISKDIDAEPVHTPWQRSQPLRPYFPRHKPDWLVELVGVLGNLGRYDLVVEAFKRALRRRGTFSIDTVLLPALRTHLRAASPAMRQALQGARDACIRHLQRRIAEPLAPPPDETRSAEGLNCACEDCTLLRAFLANPSQRACEFRINQQRRSHLENLVQAARTEIDLRTGNTGRPYPLFVTKNARNFEARVRQRRLDLVAMADLTPTRSSIDEA